MRYTNWTDTIADKLSLTKEVGIHIGLAVGIAVLISSLILIGVAPRKGAVIANAADIEQLQADIGGKVNQSDLENIFENISDTVADQAGDIDSLGDRLGDAEDRISTAESTLAEVCSPPEGYITGAFPNYTLYVKSSDAGNYTANVRLGYSPPRVTGNATYDDAMQTFYTNINWTAPVWDYICNLSNNGTDWLLCQVWFNIGVFDMLADSDTMVDITIGGLNTTYAPDFAYAEVYRVG